MMSSVDPKRVPPKMVTLPETNSLPLKINGWKMIHFLLGFGILAEGHERSNLVEKLQNASHAEWASLKKPSFFGINIYDLSLSCKGTAILLGL